jgi:hypothetical protein
VVVAVEIQDAQTAKETFGSDAVADSEGDDDATHTAGTTVVEAPKSLKQIFSKGPNFAAIEQSGQEKGRVHLPHDFLREVLITKEVFAHQIGYSSVRGRCPQIPTLPRAMPVAQSAGAWPGALRSRTRGWLRLYSPPPLSAALGFCLADGSLPRATKHLPSCARTCALVLRPPCSYLRKRQLKMS